MTVLFEFESGSRLTGTDIAGSDSDRIVIFVESRQQVTGISAPADSVQKVMPLGGDVTRHPLRKFARLAAEGNPNLVQALFVPDSMIVRDSGHARAIRSNRAMFVSKQAAQRFIGYATAQRKRMTGEAGNRTFRPDLIAQHGFDTKFAGHAYRLAAQGVELLSTGRLELPMRNPWRRVVVDIRTGVYTYEQALQLIDEQIARLIAESAVNDLPEQPDYAGINELLHEIHDDVWRAEGDPYAGIPRLS